MTTDATSASIVLGGDFRYEPAGLLDRSRLRFFMGAYGLRHRALDLLTLRLLHDFFVFQFRTRKP